MNSNLWTPLETFPICRWCPLNLTLTPYDFSLRRDDYTTLNFCRVTMLYSSITDTNQLDLTQVTVNPRWDVYFTSSQNVLTFKDNSRIKPSNNISNLRETPTSCAYRVIHDKLHWRRITLVNLVLSKRFRMTCYESRWWQFSCKEYSFIQIP